MPPRLTEPDICLILEGTYPYALGGVSSWTHELIRMQEHLSFALVAIVAPDAKTELRYTLPDNVTSLHTIRLQGLPKERSRLTDAEEAALFAALERPLVHLQNEATLEDLETLISALAPYRGRVSQSLLLDSPRAWQMLTRMYRRQLPNAAFLDYFWSWRGLLAGLYSMLLCPLPAAKAYHALCTGYAGLLLSRAHLETGRPCALTEHGIYTNERRIEILSANWLDDARAQSLGINRHSHELRDFWTSTFGNYSRWCYAASQRIITLFEGNQAFQRMDGAEEAKLKIIPNGIDVERFASISRIPHRPTVALIGRVVPIKDIKTYLRAVALLKEDVPDLRALVLGPMDEDPEYARECMALAAHLELGETISFTGKVELEDYLGSIDAVVLTSLSEAQPLVILEAGAAGVPTVATDVGSCRELILGSRTETPPLGAGGAVTPLADPRATADALLALFADPAHYARCQEAIRARVSRYYAKADQRTAYAELYRSLLETQPLTMAA